MCAEGPVDLAGDEPPDHSSPSVALAARSPDLISERAPVAALYYYKSAHWSADGTTLFAANSLNEISHFALPADLLEPSPAPKELGSSGTVRLPEPVLSFSSAPYFALECPETHLALASCTDQPIKLYSLSGAPEDASPDTSASSRIQGSYPFINQTTEAYLPATSMIWPIAQNFIVGSKNSLALFDVASDGYGPTAVIPTIPSTRHKLKGGGVGMKGTVSALSCQATKDHAQGYCSGGIGLVAAGTRTRQIGIYDPFRSAVATSLFGVAGPADNIANVSGNGVMQTAWSPCGRYLLVSERQATGMLIYDARVEGKLLGWLSGKSRRTSQQVLTCDVFAASDGAGGFEVWSGDYDGEVHVWEQVGMHEGELKPSWGWQAHEKGVSISSCALHNTGSVVATCSGSWEADLGDSEGSILAVRSRDDCCLKVWSVAFGDTAGYPSTLDGGPQEEQLEEEMVNVEPR